MIHVAVRARCDGCGQTLSVTPDILPLAHQCGGSFRRLPDYAEPAPEPIDALAEEPK